MSLLLLNILPLVTCEAYIWGSPYEPTGYGVWPKASTDNIHCAVILEQGASYRTQEQGATYKPQGIQSRSTNMQGGLIPATYKPCTLLLLTFLFLLLQQFLLVSRTPLD